MGVGIHHLRSASIPQRLLHCPARGAGAESATSGLARRKSPYL
jgi:hypothetical protein